MTSKGRMHKAVKDEAARLRAYLIELRDTTPHTNIKDEINEVLNQRTGTVRTASAD